MSTAVFTVERYGAGWSVHKDGEKVTGPVSSKWRADEQREKLERDARKKTRKCLTCGGKFLSEGAHNRMCNPCRQRSHEIY